MAQECPKCKGEGEIPCPHCQGSKRREHPTGNGVVNCNECSESGTVECPDCEGFGKIGQE